MWHALRALGKTPLALASSALTSYMFMLPGIDQVPVYARGTPLPAADMICMVDTAEPHRVGAIYEDHAASVEAHPLLIIDHHVTNAGRGQINLIDSDSASCAEVVYRLLRSLRLTITPEIATCLLMGVVTDTQSFQTSSTTPHALHTAAELLAAGADYRTVMEEVYNAVPFATTQLLGLALGRLQREGEIIWTCISQAMLRQSGADEAASDDVVMAMQRVAGARICVLFREREDGQVKISLRSKPGIDVAAIARIWNGGGHTHAAGATLDMSIATAEETVLPRLRQALTAATNRA
jgi:phosphoesterase RecJ-like protein